MKRHPFRWSIIVWVIASCLFCFLIQACLWEYLVAHRARFVSVNSYTITLSRLQNSSMLKGDTVILGSSITERLMSSDDVAVIGVPGSCFLAGKQLVNYENFAPGTVFVLEANNFFSAISEDVMADTRKLGRRLFRGNRHFSIAAMPSSLLLSAIYYATGSYSHLLADKEVLDESPLKPVNVESSAPLTAEERTHCAAQIEGIHDLRARGYRVCMAFIPGRVRGNHAELMPKLMSFAHDMNVPLLDYTDCAYVPELIFTDSVHLDSKQLSTTRFRNTIARDAKACAR